MINYRVATIDDLDDIVQFYVLCWQQTYRGIVSQRYLNQMPKAQIKERFRKQLGILNDSMAIAMQQNQIIGFVTLMPSRWHDQFNIGEIRDLYVVLNEQNKGVGKQLLDFIQKIQSKKYNQIVLITMVKNQKAMRFYEKQGFITDRQLKSQIAGGKYDCLLMHKS